MADDPTILYPGNPILQDEAKYDAWFREQVEIGMREADDPNTVMIPHEDVVRHLQELRKEWQAKAEKERNVA
jgi:hypothetical protein